MLHVKKSMGKYMHIPCLICKISKFLYLLTWCLISRKLFACSMKIYSAFCVFQYAAVGPWPWPAESYREVGWLLLLWQLANRATICPHHPSPPPGEATHHCRVPPGCTGRVLGGTPGVSETRVDHHREGHHRRAQAAR